MSTILLIKEGLFTAVALIVVVHIVSFVLSKVTSLKPSLPEICASWNKNYVMEITLGISVVVLHLLFEKFGINTAYKMGVPMPF